MNSGRMMSTAFVTGAQTADMTSAEAFSVKVTPITTVATAQSVATTIPTMTIPSAITPGRAPIGTDAIGRNTVRIAALWWIGAQATVRPTPHGQDATGTITAATAVS